VQLIVSIHKAHQAVKDICAEMLADEDVTPTQLILLNALYEQPYDKQIELAEVTGIDRSTMTDVIGRLAKKGLVSSSRLRRDDRAKVTKITPKGASIVARARVSIPRIEAELQARYPGLRALRQTGKPKKVAA
jgi:DNA-binding MarR family transcriptional regulator